MPVNHTVLADEAPVGFLHVPPPEHSFYYPRVALRYILAASAKALVMNQ